jgi:glycosyltransferase involved in cell wall biosynthesis
MADRVIVAAPRSAEALAPWRSDIEVVPNGVDSSMFKMDVSRPSDLPPGPVVGYAGKLAHRIDAALVRDVARSLPDMTFVFIGPVLDRAAIQPMAGIANVRLLGDRHYAAMPGYLRHFDVGWIPHRVGEGETGGDPIKLYEYWAAGLPVVSTRIDGMQAWADVIALVDDAAEASSAIRRMLDVPIHAPVPSDREWSVIADRMVGYLRGGGAAR